MLLSPTRMRVEPPAAANSAEAGGRSQAIAALRHVLARDNAATRCSAVRSLARMNAGDPETTQALTGLLRDPDPDVRVDAAAALGRMQAGHAVAALIENLESDPEGEVRSEVAKALGRIGSHSAVEALIHCLQRQGYPELDAFAGNGGYAPSWEVQTRSLEALGEIGDARAADAVIEALAAEDSEDFQESAFRVLARLDSERAKVQIIWQLKAGGRLARRRAAKALAALPELRGTGASFPPEFVSPLLDALLDPEAAVRIEAARALAGSGESAAVVPLTLLLGDPQPEVRTAVVSLRAAMRGERVLERLHLLLAEPDPALKRGVARALGEIGDARSAPALNALLETGDADLLYEAVHALGSIARPGAEAKLAAILADRNAHHAIRVQAARALGRICGKGGAAESQAVTDLLARCVSDADERVAHAALCALAEMDPGGAPARLADLLEAPAPAQGSGEESVRPHAEVPPELQEMVAGQTARTSTLAAILFARSEIGAQAGVTAPEPRPALAIGVRVLAVRLLGDCANPGARAIETLGKACASGDSALRRQAVLALGRIGDRRGLAALLAGLEDEVEDVRLAALEAICGLRDVPEVAGRLAALCDDPDANVRARAVQALAAGEGQEAAGRLRRTLGDENMNVCRAALHALSERSYTPECRTAIVELMFRFSGELRAEAPATLKRLGDFSAASLLLASLEDAAQEERHWICVDALAELYAVEPA